VVARCHDHRLRAHQHSLAGLHVDQQGHALGPFLLLIVVSLILCAVRLKVRSLAASTLVHASYNFYIFSLTLAVTAGSGTSTNLNGAPVASRSQDLEHEPAHEYAFYRAVPVIYSVQSSLVTNGGLTFLPSIFPSRGRAMFGVRNRIQAIIGPKSPAAGLR